MNKLLCVIAVALALFCSTGCEDMLNVGHEFINNSSYTVYIAPNGQDWNPAMVSPGSSVTIDYSGDLQYVYTPSDKVQVGDNEPGTIIFINK